MTLLDMIEKIKSLWKMTSNTTKIVVVVAIVVVLLLI